VSAAAAQALVLGGQVGVLGSGAAFADSANVARSHLEPFRVLSERRLPADSSLPGHTPAQEARCFVVGNALMSTPISAISTSAVRCLTPGIVINRSRWRAQGAICSSIASDSRSIASSRKSMCARICPTISACSASKRPHQRLAQRGDLLAQPSGRELGEHDRVARAGDERVEHVPARLAQDVRRDAAELDPAVLQDLV
jgi:hypothetical protein